MNFKFKRLGIGTLTCALMTLANVLMAWAIYPNPLWGVNGLGGWICCLATFIVALNENEIGKMQGR